MQQQQVKWMTFPQDIINDGNTVLNILCSKHNMRKRELLYLNRFWNRRLRNGTKACLP
jgi:hypothetical protein